MTILSVAGAIGRSRAGSRATIASLLAADRARVCGTLTKLLALLRALQVDVHEGHWVARGPNFYGDHLLLQRIYAGGEGSPVIADEIDGLGERIVSACGEGAVDSGVVLEEAGRLVAAWRRGTSDPVRRALSAEVSLQSAVRATYDRLRELGALSPGLDDFLMGIASGHDTNRYLLERRLRVEEGSGGDRGAANRRAGSRGFGNYALTGVSLITRDEADGVIRDWRAGPGADLASALRDRVADLLSSLKWVPGRTKAGKTTARRIWEVDQLRMLVADHPGAGIAEAASDLEIPGFTATRFLI